MKWRHWAILIVLVLLNYIIFSTAFVKLAEQQRPGPLPTRTPQPTFGTIDSRPVGWIVLPTSTSRPTSTPVTPTPTLSITDTAGLTSTVELTVTQSPPATDAPTATPPPAPATETPLPPSATPSAEPLVHTVQQGETLSAIAQQYGVTVQAISEANDIADPSRIVPGQQLVIPAPAQGPPANSPQPTATKPPTPKPTKKPPTATPKPTSAPATLQFTAQVVWDPSVAPNCSGPAIAKQSVIRDTAGNPVNGVRVEVDCYGNKWSSHPSGTPGEYDTGHYDFAFGQSSPQDWTCTARVLDVDGQPVQSSDVVSIHFDTNDCDPYGSGHQVVIVNWTRHW